ncbi:alpha/beta-hydrolase family protein [Rhizobiaceae bacterium BDR2-2]|uniref:Alpha/beta-hydrolase family protein n=1 Tax=Ectorhizobium quercum TaxID=2965071 RepID=A0AAE3MWR2_9HYPH|nr:alpha/beta-hydrolase family protein [Ectorhizobium quercum]MCX8995742.1 alpha/beta-hydrolase family protein [Ectorhizobium quercum]
MFPRRLSLAGITGASLFLAASLTPSLLPRTALMQGALSGLCLAVGYGAGTAVAALGRLLELPDLPRRPGRWIALAASLFGIAMLFLAEGWQKELRGLMAMQSIEPFGILKVSGIALAIFFALLGLARSILLVIRTVTSSIHHRVPRRAATLAGLLATALLMAGIIDGVVLRYALRAVDGSYQRLDALIDADLAAPASPLRAGGPGSLIDFDTLGRQGRSYVSTGPTLEEMERFSDKPALTPVRIYAGLNTAETVEERAALALEDLKRAGGFERKVLLLITPTGTGWVDQAAIDSIEFLHNGDIASVALQYSYLSSFLALAVEPGYGQESARALFNAVYGHWKTLPRDSRPLLYLFGLSLGAMNSDLSADFLDIAGDPFQGALWSGPPFNSRLWQMATAERERDTPVWLPRYRDGAAIRFTSQTNALDLTGRGPQDGWGPIRIVYLQYASDAVTFFEPASFYRPPAILEAPRAPDVSPSVRWFPAVTFLQMGFDMLIANQAPNGYGHSYAPEHYLDAWVAVTGTGAYDEAGLHRLRQHFVDADP